MNKYVFGDASVIEEVKKRERKIMKDIAHFRNAIAEIEKETVQIREQQLPDMQYEVSKKLTLCNEMKKETAQLTAQLDLKDRENDLYRKNGELDMTNLQLKHAVEVQELENKLKQKLEDEKLRWEKEIMQLENLKPDEKVAQEIKQLKIELKEVNDQWKRMNKENQQRCDEYDKNLTKELEDFKSSKQEPMEHLTTEQGNLLKKVKQLRAERDKQLSQMESDKKEFDSTKEKILTLQQDVSKIKISNKPLKDKLEIAMSHYEVAQKETEAIQEIAHSKEIYYKSMFDKMEEEQLRRRRLENTIEELRGRVRTFAYVTNKHQDNSLEVNYSERTITDLRHNKQYEFSRIIPSELVTESDLLCHDCEMYHEMCLQKHLNYNLISISQKPWIALRVALLEFMFKKCHEQYRIYLQYVFLSEESASQDLLLPNSKKCDNEIKLKIQKELIELDSTTTEIIDDLDEVLPCLREEREDSSPGIGIMKFQLVRPNKDQNPLSFYFIEIDDAATIPTLDKVLCPENAAKSPISLIIKKLLCDTTSCFLFDIDDSENNENLLEISKKLCQIKMAKTKRVSL